MKMFRAEITSGGSAIVKALYIENVDMNAALVVAQVKCTTDYASMGDGVAVTKIELIADSVVHPGDVTIPTEEIIP